MRVAEARGPEGPGGQVALLLCPFLIRTAGSSGTPHLRVHTSPCPNCHQGKLAPYSSSWGPKVHQQPRGWQGSDCPLASPGSLLGPESSLHSILLGAGNFCFLHAGLLGGTSALVSSLAEMCPSPALRDRPHSDHPHLNHTGFLPTHLLVCGRVN